VRSSELPAVTTAAAATTATAATTTTSTATIATIATTAVAATAATAVVTTAATAAIATATTAVAAATTTAAAIAATAAATGAEATTAAAAAARLALLGLVDAERATVEGATVHAFDSLRGFLGGTHGHEREAARAACFAIRDEVDVADRPELGECGAHAFGIGVEREISNVQTSVHPACSIRPIENMSTHP
jgi:hypothetical protein